MKTILFVLLLISLNVAWATKLDTNMLKKRIPEMMDSAGVPGVSVGIVKNGKLFWSKNFGLSNAYTKKPVTSNTVFEAASLSKPMFAFIVMNLVEKGLINLDKPLTEYVSKDSIERFFLYHKITDNRFYKITARMCLSHSAGLPNGRYGYVSIAFEPATDMSYSGEGMAYLQFVVEHLTKKNLEDLAKEYIFEPLQMKHSSFIWNTEIFANNISDSHGNGGQAVVFARQSWQPKASYSLITNGEDYAKFLEALLSQKILKPETYNQMWEVQSKAKTSFLTPMTWGLGFGLYETDLGRAFFHWGDMGTIKAYVVGIPQQKSGLVLFTNSANGLLMAENLANLCVGGGRHQFFEVMNIRQYDDPEQILLARFAKGGIVAVLETFNHYKVHYKYRLNQNLLNQITQRLLNLKRYQEALSIAKVNVMEFPKSDLAHNILADTYLRLGKRTEAVGCYRRAYQLNDKNVYAKKQLLALKAF